MITNLFSAFPIVGDPIVELLWGGFSVDNPTLNRFFSLHYLLPFMLAAVVGLHIWAFHEVGNNNPTGVEVKDSHDTVAFTPYYTVKDLYAIVVFFIFFAWMMFMVPNFMGHPDNYIPADPLVTPPHIVPEWYFLPFYAILRAVPDKLGGVLLMFGAIAVLFVLPWLDTSKVRSMNYRPLGKIAFWIFAFASIALGWLGAKPAEGGYIFWARVFTVYYFAYFLVILPVLGYIEKPKELPASISEAVLKKLGKSAVAEPAE